MVVTDRRAGGCIRDMDILGSTALGEMGVSAADCFFAADVRHRYVNLKEGWPVYRTRHPISTQTPSG